MKLNECVAVVTGGSGEIGSVLIRKLLSAGCIVINLEKAARSPGGFNLNRGQKYFHYQTNITDMGEVQGAVAKIIDRFTKVDILINNAGIKYFRPVSEMDYSDWTNALNVNLNGAFLLIKCLLPFMKDRGTGLIVNIGSKAGFKGYAGSSAYSASKAGIMRLTESIAREEQSNRVYICSLCPSTAATTDAVAAASSIQSQRFLPLEYLAEVILKIIDRPEPYHGRCILITGKRSRIKMVLELGRAIYDYLRDGIYFRM